MIHWALSLLSASLPANIAWRWGIESESGKTQFKCVIQSQWRVCMRAQSLSLVRLSAALWTVALYPWNFTGKNTGVGCHFLLQEIFPTQGWSSGLLHLLHWQADSLPLCHLCCAAVSNTGVLERWIVRGLRGLVFPFPLHYLLQRQESFQVRDKF